jgi:lipopolysaccharide transport system ATP-binding protein
MTGDVVIRAEGLGKKYVIGHAAERERYIALRDVLVSGAHSLWRKAADMARGRTIAAGDTVEEFWALKDVSFEVKRGEVLGIIGRNGAGKSTLLKVLSRITEPSAGRVTIEGRVASLLEVGTGFHPELTGRENIYLNGAILGMTRAEIRKKFDEIVAFAEVEKFLDTPVKRYSSGMYVRLAFAVAAHLEPEILVVDEVLAVGDAEFQKKSLGKMSEVASGGRTVLFVSHNMGSVAILSTKVMLLSEAKSVRIGDTRSVIGDYVAHTRGVRVGRHIAPSRGAPVSLCDAWIHDRFGVRRGWFDSDEPIFLSIAYDVHEEIGSYRVGFRLNEPTFGPILTSTIADAIPPIRFGIGARTVCCRIPENFLAPGEYTVSIAADIPMVAILFEAVDLLSFSVTPTGAVGAEIPDGRQGVVRPRLDWKENRSFFATQNIGLVAGP